MADTSTFSAAMKTKFIGPIRDTLSRGMVLLYGGDSGNPEDFQGITRSAENIDFVGNEFRIPLKVSRNQAVGFRSENEILPAPGASRYTYLTEPMRYAYGLFNITGQLLKASESNEGAFKAAFKQEMEDTVLTTKLDHNRAAWGDGTGSFAAVRTAGSDTDTTIDVSTTINFRGQEIVDVVASNGTVISPAHTVTGINRATRVLTITPALADDITTSHFLVRASSDSTIAVPNNSQNKEIVGVANIVSDSSTLHTVVPATNPFWKSYVQAVGGAISDTAIRVGLDAVGFETGAQAAGSDFALISSRGLRRRYADTLLSVKRFTNAEATTLRGGFTGLKFDEQTWYVDDSSPVGQLTGLHIPSLFWAQMSDWDWLQKDGEVLKWDSRRDRYVAALYKYSQLGTTARNRHMMLTGCTDDVR